MKRNIWAIAALLTAFAAGCDYWNPDKTQKTEKIPPEKKLELAEKCNKAGKAYFQEFLRTQFPEGYLWDEPEFHYSAKLNACLIHIRYIRLDTKSSAQRNQVVDVFANKPILYGWFERNVENNVETLSDPPRNDVPNYTSIEYFKRKDALFSE